MRRHVVDQRLGKDKAGARVHRQDGFDAGDGGADQLPFQFLILAARIWKNQRPRRSPGEEVDLVDGYEERNVVGVLTMDTRRFTGETCEAIHESGRKNVEV